MKAKTWMTIHCLSAMLGLALLAGCGKKESAEEQPAAAPTAAAPAAPATPIDPATAATIIGIVDRKSTRLNSSHSQISYAVFCLKKKTRNRGRREAAVHHSGGLENLLGVLGEAMKVHANRRGDSVGQVAWQRLLERL